MNLFAKGHITVKGKTTILADAHGTSGSERANAWLVAAQNHSVIGNNIVTNAASSIYLAGAIDVEAHAVDKDSGPPVKATARSEVLLAGKQIHVDGAATVKATASGSNAHPANAPATGEIMACATLLAGDGTVSLAHGYWRTHLHAAHVHFENAIDVEAKALGSSDLINFVGAHASAELYGVGIAVDGQATVKAWAEDSAARNDIAAARLIAAGSANSQAYGANLRDFTAGSIAFGKGIDVETYANGHSIGHVVDALTYAALTGNQVKIGGNVELLADASGHGKPSAFASTVFADVHFAIGTAAWRNDSAQGFYESGGVPRNFVDNVRIDGSIDRRGNGIGLLSRRPGRLRQCHRGYSGRAVNRRHHIVNGPLTVRTDVTGRPCHHRLGRMRVSFSMSGAGKLQVPEHILIDAEASGR